ncbi:MAG: hypothetical protein QM775_13555 [Pirellulales bacterium]
MELPQSLRQAGWARSPYRCLQLLRLTGGGIKSGCVLGWPTTILYLLGLDDLKPTFKFPGRNFRLTDVHGEVMHKLPA